MDPRIRRVLTLIEENLREPLPLATMARVAGLSSSRLRHKFKSEVGLSPAAYVQARRLSVARELLTTRYLSVKEAKAAVGITSDSYFTHRFKRAYGILPSQARADSPPPRPPAAQPGA
jgi:AraC-like DNA-binding protein